MWVFSFRDKIFPSYFFREGARIACNPDRKGTYHHHDIIDITSNASWKYPNWESWAMEQKFFSLGETLAHLVHAVHCGTIRMIIEGEVVEFYLAE